MLSAFLVNFDLGIELVMLIATRNCRSWEKKEKWNCSDIEIQRQVLRSIDAFLECINSETLQYPLVKVHRF